VARGAKREKVRLTVTAEFTGGGGELVCRTRDVSATGVFLETPVIVDAGTTVNLTLLDDQRGEAMQLVGVVARLVSPAPGTGPAGMGVKLVHIPDGWTQMLERLMVRTRPLSLSGEFKAHRRLRVLVVGDDDRRRGALALYVTSGWDVRFASDLDGAREALTGFPIDAVIAEHDLSDGRWPRILETARKLQPAARRIVRAPLGGESPPPAGARTDLVQRVVDLDAGLDAVLEALTAE
jgi:hypothetical protein